MIRKGSIADPLLTNLQLMFDVNGFEISHDGLGIGAGHIDPERFRGTCYRAANWIMLGRTTGRGKKAWSKKPNRPIKEVLGYPLTAHFRELLAEV